MTFAVGKNQVHIGWWETGVIVVGIITCTWGASAGINSYNNREEKRTEEQHLMYQKINWIAKQDTIISQHLSSIDTSIAALRVRQATTDKILSYKKLTGDYVTEKRDRSGLHFNAVR